MKTTFFALLMDKAHMNTKKLLCALMVALSVGCTSTYLAKKFSAGEIDCDEESIQIANESVTIDGVHSWIAICQGKKYLCSYRNGGFTKCEEALDQNIKLKYFDF